MGAGGDDDGNFDRGRSPIVRWNHRKQHQLTEPIAKRPLCGSVHLRRGPSGLSGAATDALNYPGCCGFKTKNQGAGDVGDEDESHEVQPVPERCCLYH